MACSRLCGNNYDSWCGGHLLQMGPHYCRLGHKVLRHWQKKLIKCRATFKWSCTNVVSAALLCIAYALWGPYSNSSWIAVWLDMYHDVVRLAMVDLDRKIDSALMYNSREKKMWWLNNTPLLKMAYDDAMWRLNLFCYFQQSNETVERYYNSRFGECMQLYPWLVTDFSW